MDERLETILGGVGGYGIGKVTDYSYEEAIERVKERLQEEKFGILSEIDMTKTVKERAGEDLGGRYIILGACNPVLAFKALSVEPEIGLLLPCNVVVADTDGGTYIGVIDPRKMLRIVENEAVRDVVYEAHERLARAIERV